MVPVRTIKETFVEIRVLLKSSNTIVLQSYVEILTPRHSRVSILEAAPAAGAGACLKERKSPLNPEQIPQGGKCRLLNRRSRGSSQRTSLNVEQQRALGEPGAPAASQQPAPDNKVSIAENVLGEREIEPR
ncbi:hypothetical protein WH47_03017 [Habropoda laboriosa]|uniref:Uncharacterized protein n=1 Tax=Habropoda laboriosa TaxID=597456 RepID=A0A0L7QT11_9HYME|nr:hypothetical protein WH47_03017 [Habropoda laboriosa]